MARSTKPPSAVRLKLAVHMRRCGSTWRAVGMEVGCSPETVRQWPRIYPQEWQAAVRDDAVQSATQAEGEVVRTLTLMLKDERKMVRLRAARSLIDLKLTRKWAEAVAIRAEETGSGWLDTVLAILQERSHVELKSLGELCLRLAEDSRNSPQPVRPRST